MPVAPREGLPWALRDRGGMPRCCLCFCSCVDGVVCAWDARSGKLVDAMTGHGDMINGISVVEGGGGNLSGAATAVVVTWSNDRKVKVFEFRLK